MTIQEAYRYLADQLKMIYEPAEAEIISDWVLENLTGIKRTDRIIGKIKTMTPLQTARMQEFLARLLQHEPVQYVLNESWFCGLKLYVDKNVLIPRPETEELVEWIISDCRFPIDTLSIFDIGSGSGCIPIALKKRLGKAEVWSCDVSQAALKVARQNASTLGIDVKFFEIDFLNKTETEQLSSFDIIVSNPPYIPENDKETMHSNVLHFEPATALFVPDNDALVFYKAIASFGKTHLNTNGVIYMEIHENLGPLTVALFQSSGYYTEMKKDMQGKERMVKAFF